MTEQEKLARDWAVHVSHVPLERIDPMQRAAAEFILANTPPETMADLKWDDDEHHLAGATTKGDAEVVMMWVDECEDELRETNEYIICEQGGWRPEDLTPNGKRYKLVEATEPDHPEVLETLEDYVNAPEGTIIARPGDIPWIKEGAVWRSQFGHDSSETLAFLWNPPRTVLRWGKGYAA